MISQAETSAAATRNITTAVVLAAVDEHAVELRQLQLAVDDGGDEQRVDRGDDGRPRSA